MQKTFSLQLSPEQAFSDPAIEEAILQQSGITKASLQGFSITKKSIDARGKHPRVNLTVNAYINEPYIKHNYAEIVFKDVHNAKNSVLIIGAGPAGLFAALKLIEQGIKPVIIERGKDVRARRRDLAILNKEGIVNPESNYCFGEGGAGTYSDGKLYTRSNKRGNVQRILNLFMQFGAEEKILYESHPHIGTNKLPGIITAMREQIQNCGGEFLFEKKLVDLNISNDQIKSIVTSDRDTLKADAYILATGHSARDIFLLLHQKKLQIEQKPFALGVRIEHPQQIIDSIQYHCNVRDQYLPPASYSLVEQVNSKGVFSFCMCPGGIIAPASTAAGELVVNGWSPSKRNNPYANSGIVVQVNDQGIHSYFKKAGSAIAKQKNFETSPLLFLHFQQAVETAAYNAGGGNFVAPAQRMADFVNNKTSSSLPDCSYLPGINSVDLRLVLPSFIHQSLQKAFVEFGKKMRGYFTSEAVVVATESRTSSPVRIPRDETTLQHLQLKNLYPCGEGVGYAGGIVSAAMDGERVAATIAAQLNAKGI
jgi:uncharacterized FAD-dependent dehydrogenase